MRAPRPRAAEGDEKPAKALLRCGEHSIAFVETLYATGTGVAVRIDDRDYVLTNLHVVDPFDSADVSLGGVEDLGRLPVAGTDVAADLALLGPVEDAGENFEPVPLGDPSPEKGDDVFLVGFPGTADVDEADLTITAGIVSRLREADGWDQTYIQTDAVIGEGQSGGALFGADGELLGISGLSYDPSFALALQVRDVEVAVDRIVAGDGDDVIQVPQSADDCGTPTASSGATGGTVGFVDDIESPTLFLPPADQARTFELAVTGPEGRFLVAAVDSGSGEPLAVNAAGLALTDELIASAVARSGMSAEELGAVFPDPTPEVLSREIAPGVLSFRVEAGQFVEVAFTLAPDAVPGELSWTSSLPLDDSTRASTGWTCWRPTPRTWPARTRCGCRTTRSRPSPTGWSCASPEPLARRPTTARRRRPTGRAEPQLAVRRPTTPSDTASFDTLGSSPRPCAWTWVSQRICTQSGRCGVTPIAKTSPGAAASHRRAAWLAAGPM